MKRTDPEDILRQYRVPSPPPQLRARVIEACAAGQRTASPVPVVGARTRWTLEIALATVAALLVVVSLATGYRGRGGVNPARGADPLPELALLAEEGLPRPLLESRPNAPLGDAADARQTMQRLEGGLP